MSELVRGFAAVLATVALIIGLIGLGTSITDQTAVLRSLLATAAGAIALAFLLAADRRRHPRPAPSTDRPGAAPSRLRSSGPLA